MEPEEEEEENIVTPPEPPPPPKPRKFDLTQLTDGFRVVLSKEQISLPVKSSIRVAYDMRGGNPLNNYHPMDFDLSSSIMKKTISGGEIIESVENHLKVLIEEHDFELRVTGFDKHRDLIVDVREENQ